MSSANILTAWMMLSKLILFIVKELTNLKCCYSPAIPRQNYINNVYMCRGKKNPGQKRRETVSLSFTMAWSKIDGGHNMARFPLPRTYAMDLFCVSAKISPIQQHICCRASVVEATPSRRRFNSARSDCTPAQIDFGRVPHFRMHNAFSKSL